MNQETQENNLSNERLTIEQWPDDKIDLVPGEVYFDFSGSENRIWYKCDQFGDDFRKQIYLHLDNPGLYSRLVSHGFGCPLLYLGHRFNRDPNEENRATFYLYFLAEEEILGLIATFPYRTLEKFVRLWPKNESRLHKNIY